MKTRKLGIGGFEVSANGFGCMGLNHAYTNILMKKATPAQIALAWLSAQKPFIVPIPGTTKLHRLDENIGGASNVLTPSDLNQSQLSLDKIKVAGERYPEELEKRTGLYSFRVNVPIIKELVVSLTDKVKIFLISSCRV